MCLASHIFVPNNSIQWKRYPGSEIFGPVANGKPRMLLLIISRGIVGMSAMLCLYQAYSRIPLGDTSAIFGSHSVWTSLIAFLFLQEKLHFLDIMALPLTLIGIICMSQPSFIFGSRTLHYDMFGFTCALAAAILASSAFNLIRKIGKTVHYTITVFYFSVAGVIIQTPMILLTGGFHSPCSFSYRLLQWL